MFMIWQGKRDVNGAIDMIKLMHKKKNSTAVVKKQKA